MARVGRFQVMATLQAARALKLGLSLDEAKSWGLNRAVFYAALGGRRSPSRAPVQAGAAHAEGRAEPGHDTQQDHDDDVFMLGGEKAFVVHGKEHPLRFRFSDDEQSPQDFDRQILRRFADWEAAWTEAMAIVEAAPREDLESAHRFFDQVYRPRRDDLAAKWSAVRP
jgi:hypothetical protein